MAHEHSNTSNQVQAQIAALQTLAATSADECLIAQSIAFTNSEVAAKVVAKIDGGYVFRSIFCKRRHSRVTVVFDFEVAPGQFFTVKPWFAAIVDLELLTVLAVQDPYVPYVDRSSGSCGCSEGQLFSDNCEDQKQTIRDKGFDHVDFTDCSLYLKDSLAEAAASAMYASYVLTNPKCSKNVTTGSLPVKHKGGIPYTSYLGWYGCDDII